VFCKASQECFSQPTKPNKTKQKQNKTTKPNQTKPNQTKQNKKNKNNASFIFSKFYRATTNVMKRILYLFCSLYKRSLIFV
jgi:hypothetical protein